MRYFLVLIIIICYFSEALPNSRTDSLEISLATADQLDKVNILNQLSQEYQEISARKSIAYASSALQLARDSGIRNDIAESLANLGSAYFSISNYKKALEYHTNSLQVFQDLTDLKGMFSLNSYIGKDHEKLGNYDKALDFYLISLKISNDLENQDGIFLGLLNLGDLYNTLNNYEKAINYYQQALDLAESSGNKKSISSVLINIGSALIEHGDYSNSLSYFHRSLEIEQELGNMKQISVILNNLGRVYLQLREYEKARTNLERSMTLILETGNQYGIAETFINIGKLQLEMKNMKEAFASINQGLQFATNINAKQLIMKGYLALSEYYSAVNNNEESLHYYKLHTQIKDNIFSESISNKLNNMQDQLEMDDRKLNLVKLQKDKEIIKLESEKKNLHLLLLFMGLVLATGFIIVLYKKYKTNNNNNKELQIEILNRMTSEKRLIKNLQIENAITKISFMFINVSDIDTCINETLAEIGSFCQASRSFLFLFNKDKTIIDNTHEWCNNNVQPLISNLQGISTTKLSQLFDKLETDEIINIQNVAKITSEIYSGEIKFLNNNAKSILILPLKLKGNITGFIGLDNVSKTIEWREEELRVLKISTEIIEAYYVKRSRVKQLETAYFGLEKKVHDRTRELAEINHELHLEVTERKRVELQLNDSFKKLKKAIEETINAFISAVEIRDPYTAGHQLRVAKLSYEIAGEMNLTKMQLDAIRIAAILHDIGKIYIPNEILSKPTSLTETEFSVIKNHPLAGYDILKTIDFQMPIAKIVYQHHEKLNGSGYPQGLIGNEIMLEARIVNVADVIDAMISQRPYRPSQGIDEALHEIESNSGILYDPEVVETCMELFTEKGFQFEEIKIRTAPRQ
ncbi:MAG: tetratricopeptide repeat protein [Candidatus Cloacimonetes bacterium]|nr:tetratricopeptide repeat protein [Candidatus Cloacimonadota bacterium]